MLARSATGHHVSRLLLATRLAVAMEMEEGRGGNLSLGVIADVGASLEATAKARLVRHLKSPSKPEKPAILKTM